jgi:DNA-damage-inducible protein J
MSKSANLYTRIEPDVKEQAEKILSILGIPASSAINMFYKQIILQRGIPFELKLPKENPLDMSKMTDDILNEELEKGYVDVKEGRVKEAKEVFNKIRKDYNL